MQTIGVRTMNNVGCIQSFFFGACGTPSGQQTRWNWWTPHGTDNNHPQGRGAETHVAGHHNTQPETYEYSMRWSVRTVRGTDEPPEDSNTGLWTAPGYDLTANRFVAPVINMYNGHANGWFDPPASIFAPIVENFWNYQCQAPAADVRTTRSGPFVMCGDGAPGPQFGMPAGNPGYNAEYGRSGERIRTYWSFRYDSLAEP